MSRTAGKGTGRRGRGAVLTIDVGNSTIRVGRYVHGRVERAETVERGAGREILKETFVRVAAGGVEGCAVASVVPEENLRLERVLRRGLGLSPLWVNAECRLGIRVAYPDPKKLGADRLANAAAAARLVGGPAIIADFGTALTFDVVTADRGYVGGVIVPGPRMFLECLAEKTALLPRLEPAQARGRWGRSTEQAMLLGWKWGYAGMVEEITRRLAGALPAGVRLVATGGMAKRIVQLLKSRYRVIPDLTLIGIGVVYELNRERTGADEPD